MGKFFTFTSQCFINYDQATASNKYVTIDNRPIFNLYFSQKCINHASEFFEEKSRLKNWHCLKYRYFTSFPGVEILWKGTVSAEFRLVTCDTKLRLFHQYTQKSVLHMNIIDGLRMR